MKRILPLTLFTLTLPLGAAEQDGWLRLFNGRNLEGWKANENVATFSVQDGKIVVRGPRAHLFYVGPVQNHNFKNFEFKADVLTKPGSNSGVYFHTVYEESGWPAKGYEVQVNNSHRDPKRTAGLYGISDNLDAPAMDDEWFTLHIKVEGKRILTQVNGWTIIDYREEDNVKRPKQFEGRLLGRGTFALQGHDPGSEVHFRNIMVRPLP
jgi:hypothetical protein